MENNNSNNLQPEPHRRRDQDDRVNIIHRMVYEATYLGKKVTTKDLATVCGVDERTIYEDRAYMERIDMPMAFCRKENTWKYTKAVERDHKVLMNEAMVFTLMVAEKTMRECHSLSRRRNLLRVFKQIASQFTDLITFDFDAMDDHVTVATMLQPKFDPDRVEYLCRCIGRCTELNLVYDTPKKGKKRRRVWPLHLYKADRDWILFVWDFNRNGIIRLALGRMYDIEESGKTFVRPPFSIEKELEGALIIWNGEEIMDVGLMFDSEVAHVIRENTVRCEVGREHYPDGSLKLILRLGSLKDLPMLIGPYGEHAYPLYPPRAVKEYKAAAREMLKVVGATETDE